MLEIISKKKLKHENAGGGGMINENLFITVKFCTFGNFVKQDPQDPTVCVYRGKQSIYW